jgi:hypothetical protein
MSINHSSQITTNGLVFYYDMKNYKSFWGEPTTNLSYNNGQGGSEYLAASYTWTNSGTWTLITDETDVSPPAISYSQYLPKNLRIISGMTLTVGSQHFGCGFTTISPSTQYTFSVWFMQNRAGCSAPYLRTNVNNNSLGNFAYNGNTDSSTWPVNQWIRISCTGTTQANENGLYLSNYIGYSIGDKIWYYGHQLEAKSYPTSLVAGTRSNTQAILDLTNNNTITATSLTYVSDSTFSFNGSSGNITSSSFTGHQTISGTIMGWAYPTSTSGDLYLVAAGGTNTYGASRAIRINSGSWCAVNYGSSTEDWNGIVGAIINTWQHIAYVWSGTTIRFYFNGVEYTNTRSGMVIPLGSVLTIGATAWSPVYGYFPGKINSIQAYSRALSSPEVLQNFNAQRGIYGI